MAIKEKSIAKEVSFACSLLRIEKGIEREKAIFAIEQAVKDSTHRKQVSLAETICHLVGQLPTSKEKETSTSLVNRAEPLWRIEFAGTLWETTSRNTLYGYYTRYNSDPKRFIVEGYNVGAQKGNGKKNGKMTGKVKNGKVIYRYALPMKKSAIAAIQEKVSRVSFLELAGFTYDAALNASNIAKKDVEDGKINLPVK